MKVALVALVAMFPTWLAADERLSAGRSALRTGLFTVVFAVPVLVVLFRVGSGSEPTAVMWGVWLVGAVVAAGFFSIVYAPLLILGGWLAGAASRRPAGSIGAGRWLLLFVATIAAVASWGTVTARHGGEYRLWRELLAFDAMLAVLCIGVAVRDGVWAVRLRAVAAGRDPKRCVVRSEWPSSAIPALASSLGPGAAPAFALARVSPVDEGAYRASRAATPLLLLDGPPLRVVASLWRSAFVASALALALARSATVLPAIAHLPPIPRPPEIAHAPIPEAAVPGADRQDVLDGYAPWWLRDPAFEAPRGGKPD